MDLEKKIINEINEFQEPHEDLNDDIIQELIGIFIKQSILVSDKEKNERDASNYIENKINDIIK